jgi:hypothetical protein
VALYDEDARGSVGFIDGVTGGGVTQVCSVRYFYMRDYS